MHKIDRNVSLLSCHWQTVNIALVFSVRVSVSHINPCKDNEWEGGRAWGNGEQGRKKKETERKSGRARERRGRLEPVIVQRYGTECHEEQTDQVIVVKEFEQFGSCQGQFQHCDRPSSRKQQCWLQKQTSIWKKKINLRYRVAQQATDNMYAQFSPTCDTEHFPLTYSVRWC